MCSQARDGGAERLRDGREGELDILKTLSDHCFLLQLLLFPLQCQSCVFVLIGSLWWKSCREPNPPSKLLFIGQESLSLEYGLNPCTNGLDWLKVNDQLNNAYVRSLYADQQAVSSDSQETLWEGMCRVIRAVNLIIWFRPLKVSLGELSVQWCSGNAERCRSDGQMWTDRPTDPWLIVHLSAPAAESLGTSSVLCWSTLCLSLISHAFALSFSLPFYFRDSLFLSVKSLFFFSTRNLVT